MGRPDDGGIEEVVADEGETVKLSSEAPGKLQDEDTQVSWEKVDGVNAQAHALGIPAPFRPGSISLSWTQYRQRAEALATEDQRQQLRTQTLVIARLQKQQDQRSQVQPMLDLYSLILLKLRI